MQTPLPDLSGYKVFVFKDTEEKIEELEALLDTQWKILRADTQPISTGNTTFPRTANIVYILKK